MAGRATAWVAVVVVTLSLIAETSVISYRLGSDTNDEMTSDSSGGPSAATLSEDAAATGYSDCGVKVPVAGPESMTMTCADGGLGVTQIDWRSWESAMALGTGTVTANNCDPSCAEGAELDYPATILMDGVVANGAGPQFTRAVIIYADRTPNYDGRDVDSFNLAPYVGRE
ncbi:MAG: hypothetical protein WA966_08795 [Ornithinimicrobium sp.]